MPDAGGGKGTMQADIGIYRRTSQYLSGHQTDPHSPCGMGTGWPHHGGPEYFKDIHERNLLCIIFARRSGGKLYRWKFNIFIIVKSAGLYKWENRKIIL